MGPCSYVLPLRWSPDLDADELAAYLRTLIDRGQTDDVLVVDGSPEPHFSDVAERLPASLRHVRPDPDLDFANGKVNGVITGLRLARHDKVVVADDDVRYDGPDLACVAAALDWADVVVPQNYFRPMPWHAVWDTARTLLARATGGDFPGTLGVRRDLLLGVGGYDGNVLFENLELLRTVQAAGGRVHRLNDCFVPRLPPTARRFWSQRPRQAYDEWARPARLAAALAVLPAVARVATSRRRTRIGVVLAFATATMAAAEAGRRAEGGTRVFPAVASLFAPVWVLERGVCAWLAVVQRLTGGCRYGGRRLTRAATPTPELADRLAPAA
ncbi:MAG: hypothetical protein QOK43_2606 [Acidimicrobiaceae bacterium]|nr:hypothetical protein [Acidimicrobiaceae bacterium]